MQIKVFDYIEALDCFVVRKEFQDLVEKHNLTEWSPVVWIGRLFARNQDFGEHWFDNWDERERLLPLAKEKGVDLGDEWDQLVGERFLVIVPERHTENNPYCMECKEHFQRLNCPNCGKNLIGIGADGPCYSDEIVKLFWTDVLKSLSFDTETIQKIREKIRIGQLNFPKLLLEWNGW